ncbi:MAG: polyribonucleotide nucleotidyltransferase [Oscillospiraceae bacterium]|nr:polyribonucleotide nucleotidyltransferase [Oscillospiraceae bacterium]
MSDNKVKEFEIDFANKKLFVQIGKMCGLANGSCLVKYGNTTVLVNAVASKKPREGVDFMPLSVDFEERLYAVGKIPGSFLKREGRPTENAILASRLVDRSIRPLFNKDMRNDVTVTMTVMSVDLDYSPEIAGMIGASIALSISDIPWEGPIAAVNVGLVDNKIIINPSEQESLKSKMRVTVSASEKKIVMIEANANQVPESTIIEGIKIAHEEIKKIVDFILDIKSQVGKPKFEIAKIEISEEMINQIREFSKEDLKFALDTNDKNIREERLAPIIDRIHEKFDEIFPEQESLIDECIYKIQKEIVRSWLINENKRVDGRAMDEMRPLSAEVNLIPRVHGSGMFTRGQTQVLSVATLGVMRDAQTLDGIDGEESKRYIHHYNFPSYSVGETKPSRGPGRREIGHGALAERALEPVIPPVEKFPYTIRVVSEVLSSNGSTSQASICGSTLALMQAGVPIVAPVAGISCGLITDGDRWMTMLDIQGVEDFFGDMDFKVAGTHTGVTAIQMDIKVDGLTYDIIEEALEKTRKARLYILDEIMLKAIKEPSKEISEYALKVVTTKIETEKIRDVIGPGGKMVQKICADNDVKIDIEDDGQIYIYGFSSENTNSALLFIEALTKEPAVGATYKGKVVKTATFGAFVEFAPGKEGLVHISKLDNKRVEKTEDIVNVGDEIFVKIIEIDPQGRVNLSRILNT